MDEIDFETIREYVNIPRKIKRLMQHKKQVDYNFHHQSFLSSSMGFNEDGTRVKLLPVDKMVINYITRLEYIDFAINILKFKYKNFTPVLDKVQSAEVILLKRGEDCSSVTAEKLSEEIAEIEEATSWKFNLEPESATHITDDVNENLENILELLS